MDAVETVIIIVFLLRIILFESMCNCPVIYLQAHRHTSKSVMFNTLSHNCCLVLAVLKQGVG
jgi:hypothetical protein